MSELVIRPCQIGVDEFDIDLADNKESFRKIIFNIDLDAEDVMTPTLGIQFESRGLTNGSYSSIDIWINGEGNIRELISFLETRLKTVMTI